MFYVHCYPYKAFGLIYILKDFVKSHVNDLVVLIMEYISDLALMKCSGIADVSRLSGVMIVHDTGVQLTPFPHLRTFLMFSIGYSRQAQS